jgi:hypothetical protein
MSSDKVVDCAEINQYGGSHIHIICSVETEGEAEC